MVLSKWSHRRVSVIVNHCIANGMNVESTMGLWNLLVKLFSRLDRYEGRTPRGLESVPTDKQQAKERHAHN